MCADDHVYLTALEPLEDLLLLLCCAEAREQLNPDRVALKSLGYCLVVLPREDSRRAEQRALL